jgi:hypothetical protein
MTLQYVPTLTHTSRANKFITAGRIRPMKIRPASSPITEISCNLRPIYTKTRNRSVYIKKNTVNAFLSKDHEGQTITFRVRVAGATTYRTVHNITRGQLKENVNYPRTEMDHAKKKYGGGQT